MEFTCPIKLLKNEVVIDILVKARIPSCLQIVDHVGQYKTFIIRRRKLYCDRRTDLLSEIIGGKKRSNTNCRYG
jgi:hypothetical protein